MKEHEIHQKTQNESNNSIEQKVDEILLVLRGSFENEGIVSVVRKISKDLHDIDTGLVGRVKNLESTSDKQKGWLLGSAFIGGIVAWFIQLFFGNHK